MTDFGAATFPSIGTTAQVVVSDARELAHARDVLEDELREIDVTCSRFRDDSELIRVNAAAGEWIDISPGFEEALHVALRAARLTDGVVDPTLGACLEALGYDRDFAAIEHVRAQPTVVPTVDWRSVQLEKGRMRMPRGVKLDLGATAKALAADRAAARTHRETGCGVLVNLGGDISVAGAAPDNGWRIALADDHRSGDEEVRPAIVVIDGGVATSSTVVRRWSRGEGWAHHIVDPATGVSAAVVWRTATVAARTCVDANTASTAAVVLGARALPWLAARRLPCRLVGVNGDVVTTADWPSEAA